LWAEGRIVLLPGDDEELKQRASTYWQEWKQRPKPLKILPEEWQEYYDAVQRREDASVTFTASSLDENPELNFSFLNYGYDHDLTINLRAHNERSLREGKEAYGLITLSSRMAITALELIKQGSPDIPTLKDPGTKR
jgi:hypothetical protein